MSWRMMTLFALLWLSNVFGIALHAHPTASAFAYFAVLIPFTAVMIGYRRAVERGDE